LHYQNVTPTRQMLKNLQEEFRGTFSKPNNGLNQIIVINAIIFGVILLSKTILVLSGYSSAFDKFMNYLMLPASYNHFIKKPWTLFTYFFLHERIFHILFNLLFLYWFGMIIKDLLGNKRLINLYILGGLSGGILYLLLFNSVPYFKPIADSTYLLGASASVMAIVVGAAVLSPDYTFFMIFLGPVKIKYIAGFYIILAVAGLTDWNAGGETAHLGGALMGFLFVWQLRKGNDLGKPVTVILEYIASAFKESSSEQRYKSKMKVHKNQTASNTTAKKNSNVTQEKPSQEIVDRILDKISKSGYESLSRDEKEALFKASDDKG